MDSDINFYSYKMYKVDQIIRYIIENEFIPIIFPSVLRVLLGKVPPFVLPFHQTEASRYFCK